MRETIRRLEAQSIFTWGCQNVDQPPAGGAYCVSMLHCALELFAVEDCELYAEFACYAEIVYNEPHGMTHHQWNKRIHMLIGNGVRKLTVAEEKQVNTFIKGLTSKKMDTANAGIRTLLSHDTPRVLDILNAIK